MRNSNANIFALSVALYLLNLLIIIIK